jgi:hypothetical protein
MILRALDGTSQLGCMSCLHAKCGCPSPAVQRHGGRRRRCANCGKTWSVRPRRRGRNPIRVSVSLSRRLLSDKESTRRLARDSHRSVETIRRRCRSSWRRLVEADALPAMPTGDGPLLLIVDGRWFRFQRQVLVSYDMAVKPPGSPTAYFLDSVMLAGQECGAKAGCCSVVIATSTRCYPAHLTVEGSFVVALNGRQSSMPCARREQRQTKSALQLSNVRWQHAPAIRTCCPASVVSCGGFCSTSGCSGPIWIILSWTYT